MSGAEPAGFSIVTKASAGPSRVESKAPTVVGKSADSVRPVTYAFPAESTAMPEP